MKKLIIICVVVNLIILSNVSFAANWTPFIIRNANTSGDAPTYLLSGGVLTVDVDSATGGQKVGYGTSSLDGGRLDSITRFQVVRLDSHENDYAPYINIWVTDGTHYAVLSLEPSHYSQFDWTHDLEAADYLSIEPWIYETDTSDLTWILTDAYYDGRYIKVSGAAVTIADIGHLTIKPPTPSEFAAGLPGVGSGAPRELDTDIAFGFTLVFGDTQSNYIGGYQIDANPTLGPPQEVWVDDDYCATCGNDGHTWGYDAFNNIQGGVDAVAGSTVHVAAGTYNENIIVDKKLMLQGAGSGDDPDEDTIIVSATENTDVIRLLTGGISTLDRMVIRDLRVTGATGAGNAGAGIEIAGGDGFTTFDNVTATGNEGHGVAINVSSAVMEDIKVLDSTLSYNDGSGFKTPSSASVDGLTLIDSHVDHNGMGLYISGPVTGLTVDGGTYNDNHGPGSTDGVGLYTGSPTHGGLNKGFASPKPM